MKFGFGPWHEPAAPASQQNQATSRGAGMSDTRGPGRKGAKHSGCTLPWVCWLSPGSAHHRWQVLQLRPWLLQQLAPPPHSPPAGHSIDVHLCECYTICRFYIITRKQMVSGSVCDVGACSASTSSAPSTLHNSNDESATHPRLTQPHLTH